MDDVQRSLFAADAAVKGEERSSSPTLKGIDSVRAAFPDRKSDPAVAIAAEVEVAAFVRNVADRRELRDAALIDVEKIGIRKIEPLTRGAEDERIRQASTATLAGVSAAATEYRDRSAQEKAAVEQVRAELQKRESERAAGLREPDEFPSRIEDRDRREARELIADLAGRRLESEHER